MIRLGLMLELSRQDEYTAAGPIGTTEAHRVLQVRGETVWYAGMPFEPRRATIDTGYGSRPPVALAGR